MYLLFHWEQFKWASEPRKRNSKKIKIKLQVRPSVKIYGVKDLHDIFFRIYFMWIDISYKIDISQRPTSSSVSDRKMFRFYKKFINSLSVSHQHDEMYPLVSFFSRFIWVYGNEFHSVKVLYELHTYLWPNPH